MYSIVIQYFYTLQNDQCDQITFCHIQLFYNIIDCVPHAIYFLLADDSFIFQLEVYISILEGIPVDWDFINFPSQQQSSCPQNTHG